MPGETTPNGQQRANGHVATDAGTALTHNTADSPTHADAPTPAVPGEAAEPEQKTPTAEPVKSTPGSPYHRFVRILLPNTDRAGVSDESDYTRVDARQIEPETRSVWKKFREIVLGDPIPTERAIHQRIGKIKALALLSSDALSSVAYGTEASLAVLVVAGVGFSAINLGIGLAIISLLAIVAFSYRQTIMHYPTGGGSYIVSRAHLGVNFGLVAAAALLIDYVLTVSVSISAGVDAIVSAFGGLAPYSVLLGVLFIGLIMLVNLRGVRESGSIFAVPTYLFVVSYLIIISVGLIHAALSPGGLLHALPPKVTSIVGDQRLGVFLILTAFASGCSAMTGTEAIADGVPVFSGATPRDQSKNAATTLLWMATLLAVMYGGTTFLTWRFGITPYPNSHPTVISQIASLVATGWFGWFYYVFQFSTTLILTLAANTSFSDFPRLSSILARDDFMPHIFGLRGGRLAFNTGIVVLGVLSAILLVVFQGSTDALINLYALGVFTAFTMSQSGMVARWRSLKEPGWQRGMVISTVGAIATGIVTLIIVVSKFPRGAWVVVILVPLLVWLFHAIHHHYETVKKRIEDMPEVHPYDIRHVAVVPIASLNRLALRGLAYARAMTPYVIAVHVTLDDQEESELKAQWEAQIVKQRFFRGGPLPADIESDDVKPVIIEKADPNGEMRREEVFGPHLTIIQSPFRLLGRPLLNFIDRLQKQNPDDIITVVLPEYVAKHWWESILHNQTALWLKFALLGRPNLVTTNVPYHENEAGMHPPITVKTPGASEG